ncbi:MAG: helix-turn-helix transcriptional regulator [Lentisphaeraceae bacterium]|nr:helix-turn-helix transcriptional regulator [Lentisphaeraceae bacterium]
MEYIFLRSRDIRSLKGFKSAEFHVPVYRIIHVIDGEGTYDFAGDILPVKAGDIFLASPGYRSIDFPGEQNVRLHIINFTAADYWMEKPYDVFAERGRCYHLLTAVCDDLVHGLERRRENFLEMAIDLFVEQGQLSSVNNRVVFEIAEQIKANPHHKYNVKELALKSGCSLSHFRALFKEETKLSPKAYIKKCKMDYALKLLRDENLRVKEVADILSYNDIHEFSKQFKTVFGKSPIAMSKRRPGE